MTRPLGVAVVGCGRVAALWHLPALARVAETAVAGLADVDQSRLEALGERTGVSRRTTDYRELLDDTAVDAVAVCVPPELHAEVACAALAAGKHVLVEKPLALTLDDCEAIVDAAAASPATAAVGFNQRLLRPVLAAREARRSGVLGEIKLLRSTFTSESRFRPEDPAWRRGRATGGGVLLEQAIHHLDLWRFLLDDEVEEVFAVSAGDDESATVTGRTAAGTLVSGGFSDAAPPVNELELFGTAARTRINAYRFDGFEVVPRERPPGSPRDHVARAGRLLRALPVAARELRGGGGFQGTYASQWRAFVAAARDGAPVHCPVTEGMTAVRILLAATASSATGRSVPVAEAPREPAPLAPPAGHVATAAAS
jgi:predicted dehydrogenase